MIADFGILDTIFELEIHYFPYDAREKTTIKVFCAFVVFLHFCSIFGALEATREA